MGDGKQQLRFAAAALVAGCGSDSTAENAATNTNATASTNDDTGTASPAQGTAAAGRGVRLVKVGDFQSPLYVTAPPGDRRRIFVVEQAGRIVVVRGGKPLASLWTVPASARVPSNVATVSRIDPANS